MPATFSVSVTLLPPPFLATVGLHCSKWEPVGVCLDPLFVCIALCNRPIAGRSRSRCVYAFVCSENMSEMNCNQHIQPYSFHPQDVLALTCVLSRLLKRERALSSLSGVALISGWCILCILRAPIINFYLYTFSYLRDRKTRMEKETKLCSHFQLLS